MTEALLDIDQLSVSFPGTRALDGMAMQVHAGEIVALVGQNGSGKSTLVKVLAGIHTPDPGSRITLGTGANQSETELHFIHQDLGLINTLSTVENLDLGRRHRARALLPTSTRTERTHAQRLLADFGAHFDVTTPIGKLSAAERTIVAIARALEGWTHAANILILDEPTVALHSSEVQQLFTAVRQVATRGAGVVFISHRLDEVMDLADRVVVLRDGLLIADTVRGQFDHDTLVELIAGQMVSASNKTPTVDATRHSGEHALPVMRAQSITGPTLVGLDLELCAGEIVGISGVLGSGREQVAPILFGAGSGTVASLEIDGRPVALRGPRAAINAGMAYLPADRRGEGAVMGLTARENLTLPRLRPLRRRAWRLDRRAERVHTVDWFTRVELRPLDPERTLGLFSGGNQQKVVLAKWMRNNPRVLLLDEPTQGVDVGAKVGIFHLIADAAAGGAAVLICSSDAKELALTCDRVIVLRDGQLAGEFTGDDLTEARLVSAGLQPPRPARVAAS